MNAKIQKMQEELKKNTQKVSKLQARNEELKRKLTELENTEIVGMVRAAGLTLEQLAVLLPALKEKPIPQKAQEVFEVETE